MIYPTIHLNGDKKDTLLQQQIDAGQAANALLKALQEAQPNARNYYVSQDKDAYRKAMEEHAKRMMAVGQVLRELENLAEHIADE